MITIKWETVSTVVVQEQHSRSANKVIEFVSGLQKTDFLPVQTDFYFVKPIQFA